MILKVLFTILLNAGILYLASQILPDTLSIHNYQTLGTYSILLSLLNILLMPLIKLINLPLKYLSFGLSSVLIQVGLIFFTINFSNLLSQSPGLLITNDFLSYLKLAIVIGLLDFIKNLIK